FTHFHGDRYFIHSRVTMPNHVHVLVTLSQGVKLDLTVGTWKRYTSRMINRALETEGALWQKNYFDRIVRDWKHFANVARYIRKNAAKANLGGEDFTLWEDDRVKFILG